MEAVAGYLGAHQAIGATTDGDVVLRTGYMHTADGTPVKAVDGIVTPQNVLYFAPVGLGGDDTAAIQAAIDNLPSTGGEVILPGVTMFVSGIRLDGTDANKTNVTLRGQGRSTTIKKLDNSAMTTAQQKRSNVIYALTGGGFVVRDFNVVGNYSRNGSRAPFTTKHTLGAVFGSAGSVISVASDGTNGTNNPTDKAYLITVTGAGQTSSAVNISVDVGLGYVTDVSSQVWDEVTETGYYNYYQSDDDFAYRHGIYMNGTFDEDPIYDCVVENVHVTDCVYGGIVIGSGPLIGGMTYNGSIRSRISNCYVYNNNGSNIGGGNKLHQTVTGCTVFGGNSSGIRMDEGSHYSTITGCTIEGNSSAANGGINLYKSDYCSITGNTVKGAGTANYWINSSDFVSFTGNTSIGGTSVGVSWIGNYGLISSNTVILAASHGIQITSSKEMSVTANSCHKNGGAGIRLSGGASANSITANNCFDNSTAGGTVNSGINVDGCNNSVFSSNRCGDSQGGSATQNYGINEIGTSDNNVFVGNFVINNKNSAGIVVKSTSHDIMNIRGTTTDVDVSIDARGAGVMQFGAFSSNGDAAVNGYVTMKTLDGTSRKLATIA